MSTRSWESFNFYNPSDLGSDATENDLARFNENQRRALSERYGESYMDCPEDDDCIEAFIQDNWVIWI